MTDISLEIWTIKTALNKVSISSPVYLWLYSASGQCGGWASHSPLYTSISVAMYGFPIGQGTESLFMKIAISLFIKCVLDCYGK